MKKKKDLDSKLKDLVYKFERDIITMSGEGCWKLIKEQKILDKFMEKVKNLFKS